MYNNRAVGRDYEAKAAGFLRKKGYFIIDTNFNTRQAEIDIVARDKGTIVFVEVKYRKNASGGHPLEAVDLNKQRKVCRAALCYMSYNKISPDNTPVRFDVIGIMGDEITHVENAFDFII